MLLRLKPVRAVHLPLNIQVYFTWPSAQEAPFLQRCQTEQFATKAEKAVVKSLLHNYKNEMTCFQTFCVHVTVSQDNLSRTSGIQPRVTADCLSSFICFDFLAWLTWESGNGTKLSWWEERIVRLYLLPDVHLNLYLLFVILFSWRTRKLAGASYSLCFSHVHGTHRYHS